MSKQLIKLVPIIILVTIVLFAFRVIAQFIEAFVDIPGIPNFEEWHSASVPYWRLLVTQIIILTFMVVAYYRFHFTQIRKSKLRGEIYLIWGVVYLIAMISRHILGLTIYSETVWFTSFLSIYFHYVLAAFLITIGTAHFTGAKSQDSTSSSK